MVADLYNSINTPRDDPKSEPDSHTNVIVLEKHCFVFEWYGKSCTVNLFNYCLGSVKDVPIIDAVIAYDCPYFYKCYIIIFHNFLYLPNMEDDSLPPFIMRESGATVNDTPKIHCTDSTSKYHCTTFAESELKIPFHINGTFYLFHIRRPNSDELQSCDKIFITPECQHWNPYCTSYDINDRYM